ncbi:MAG: cation diffusion facilitator family transporter [Candidatus Competibacteraceae bacterium]
MNAIAIDTAHSARLLRLATYASVITALVLIAGKIAAWLMTGSVSVMASLVDSMLDAAASIINLLAVRYSLMPPDSDHRFGHGKAEPLAGLGQAAFIAGSAVFLTLQAIERLLHPRPLQDLAVGIGVMTFAIVATLVLVMIQRHVIARTNSTAIRADSLHYFTDLITNLSTIIALVLAYLGWPGLDPWFALGIAAYILYSAFQIGIEAVQLLMDRELPGNEKERIIEIAHRHPAVRGVHDLRTRRSGQTYFIQFHLEFDGTLPLQEAHKATDEVFSDLQKAFPNADVLIHEDPAGVEESAHTQKL